MGAPQEIIELVDRFREQSDSYRSPSYGETALRREFLDPFIKALGWDIDNKAGYAEAYKDVVHEDAIKIGGSTKAPDYSLRIGGVRKFFIEAKKPSVNIAQDTSPAFQLRRYAWSAGLPLSILTDFEEFAVYDCRVRPQQNDKASTARIKYLKYEQYDEHWDEIASIFSPEAIRKGSFDKYAESNKKKRGTAGVDDAFLKEIEAWRSDLARNLASRNAELSQREINFAVQKTIDRIIFLRICEDRGIETYGGLQALQNGTKVYARLCELFRKADDRYNSGLFHFTKEKNRSEDPDQWTLGLQIDDRVLKDIIRNLYYPESPYEFSVMPAEILGQVYEQFLGKVIRLTKGHQAKVEDKPEVKKAGGVYYTPKYIVDYIVEQTVGKLLAGKTPNEIAARTKTWKPAKAGRPLTVLDPACGSGSFLIGAYQYLLDWYRDWYVDNDPAQHKDRIYQVRHDQWRLTTAERKRILLDHIYGVDIDAQAVEVTKLSLLLKVLEGENQESLQRQLLLFHERALPDLADNIKCGNSLFGPDFYQGKQLDLFDDDERLRINVFDWQAEFPEIMRSGGFDAVIGNPPYGAELAVNDRAFLSREFDIGITDTAALFMVQARRLLANGGVNGFIVPKPFTYASNWRRVQQELLGEITDIVDVGKVWKQVKLEQVIYRLEKSKPRPTYASGCRREHELITLGAIEKSECEKFGFLLNGIEPAELKIAQKMISAGEFLGDICTNVRGGMLQGELSENGNGVRVIGGKQIQRFMLVGSKGFLSRKLTEIPPQARVHSGSILVQNIVAHITRPSDHIKIIGTVVPEDVADDILILDTVNQLTAEPGICSEFLLGLLHSRLVNWFVYRFIFAKAIRTMHFDGPVSSRIPVRLPGRKSRSSCHRHNRISQIVRDVINLAGLLQTKRTPNECRSIERQIRLSEEEIDRLVYELYELSSDEITLVEKSHAMEQPTF